jgi:hypothetical protein
MVHQISRPFFSFLDMENDPQLPAGFPPNHKQDINAIQPRQMTNKTVSNGTDNAIAEVIPTLLKNGTATNVTETGLDVNRSRLFGGSGNEDLTISFGHDEFFIIDFTNY